MFRSIRTRRGITALLATALLTLSVATPAAAGDELVVRRGDTLWDLARQHGVTVAQLVAWNRIENPALIRVGQRIVLHPPAPAAAPAAPLPASAPVIHVARAGDTLWDIALRYGTTVAALAAANGLSNPSFIRVGQAIAVPQPAAAARATAPSVTSPPSPASAPVPASVVHVVQRGETLWVISARYGVTIAAIVQANGLADPSYIRTGQSLTIPATTPSPAAAPASARALPPGMAAMVATRTAARDLLAAAAAEFGVAPAFVLAVAWHESGWQTDVVSYAGAVGLMQLMPSTATWIADTMLGGPAAIHDPRWNARAGTRLLAFYLARYHGDKTTTLAAYFQGMSSVETTGVLRSSQPYIDSILALEAMFSR
jgi:LysM repeat protein